MKTVKLGTSDKYLREYKVKPLPSLDGKGGISLILGDPTDERGNKLYPGRKRPQVQALSRLENKAKYTPEESVGMAASDDPARPVALHHVHIDNGRMVAADGFRLHTAPTDATECEFCKANECQYPQWPQLFPQTFNYTAEIESEPLYKAFIMAGIFAREGSNVAKVHVNGKIEVIGTSEETGESVNEIPCTSEGPDMIFGIRWEFARDAIKHVAPKGGKITLKVKGPTSPIVFEANDRQALVMPMMLHR